MQVEASANVQRLHNVSAIVINQFSRSEGSSARPRYETLPLDTTRPSRLVGRAGVTSFDSVAHEETISDEALYGVFAEPAVQRAVTRHSGAVFVQGKRRLYNAFVRKAVDSVFTHRPLSDKRYVLHWAYFHYAVVPAVPAGQPQDDFWTAICQSKLLICDFEGGQLRHVLLQRLEDQKDQPLTMQNATRKQHILGGVQQIEQHKKQGLGRAHALYDDFLLEAGSAEVHTALAIRILSRGPSEGVYRASHCLVIEPAGPAALALELLFPAATNTVWLSCISGFQSTATDTIVQHTAGVKGLLRQLGKTVNDRQSPVHPATVNGAKVLVSPSPHRPKVVFSPEPLSKGIGYNAQQQKKPVTKPIAVHRPGPCHFVQPLKLFEDGSASP